MAIKMAYAYSADQDYTVPKREITLCLKGSSVIWGCTACHSIKYFMKQIDKKVTLLIKSSRVTLDLALYPEDIFANFSHD